MPTTATDDEAEYIRLQGRATHARDPPDISVEMGWELYGSIHEFKSANLFDKRTHTMKVEPGLGTEQRPAVYIMCNRAPLAPNFRGAKVENGPATRPVYTVIAKSTAPMRIAGVGHADLIVIMGQECVAVDILVYLRVTGVKRVSVPGDIWEGHQHSERINYGPTSFKSERPTIWTGTEEQLYQLCLTPNVSQINKTISLLYNVYPHFRDYATRNFASLPIDIFPDMTGQALANTDINGLAGKNINLMMTLTTWTLAFAFTQDGNVVRQLTSRAKAIAANVASKAPTMDNFQAYKDSVVLNLKDLSAWFDEVMGQVICIGDVSEFEADYVKQRDEHNKVINHNRLNHIGYNPAIRPDDLITFEEYNQTYYQPGDPSAAIAKWHWENLLQMRIVYVNKHTSTVRFAVSARAHIRPLFTQLGEEWGQEMEKVDELSPILGDHPYLGLVANLPKSLQVGQIPRACVVGLLHFGNNLKSQEEIDRWKLYEIAAVKEKVGSDSQLSICEAIANNIPTNSLTAKAELMKYISLEESRRIIRGMEKKDLDAIYHYLQGQDTHGSWYDAEFKRRTDEELNELKKIARSEMESRFERQRRIIGDQIDAMPAGQDRTDLKSILNDRRAEFDAFLDRKTDFLALLPVRKDGTNKQKVDQTTNDLHRTWDNLDTFTFGNLRNFRMV